jgi:HrpA-like RNA helicase
VEGRQHPIREHFPATGTNDYVAEAARVVLDIHRSGSDAAGRGDIIVFMPGEAEKKDLVALLEKRADRGESSLRLLTLDRNAVLRESADYRLIASADAGARATDPRRWVVVATAVAETGLTIPSLRYVVDCGWARTKEIYFPAQAGGLVTRPAPESRVRQRFGRVGRKFPGDAFPLYTRNVYTALDRAQLPAIVAEGVEGIFLDLIAEQQRCRGVGAGAGACREFRVEALDLLDAPPALALWAALDTAILCGFVSIDAPVGDAPVGESDAWLSRAIRGYGLTPLGRIAASFNEIPMMPARAVLAGVAADACIGDLVSIAAMFGRPLSSLLADSAPRPGLPPDAPALRVALPRFLREALGGAATTRGAVPPSEEELFYFRARLLIADDFIEAMLVLEAFLDRLATDGGRAWCADANLSFEALVAAVERRDEIVGDLLAAGFDPYGGAEKRLADADPATFLPRLVELKRCLFEGLRPRLLTYDERDNVYRGRNADTPVHVPPLFLDSTFDRLRTLGAASAQSKPRWVATDELKLKAVKPAKGGKESGAAPILYRVRTGMVSVLDDFVAFDPTLAGPRVFPLEAPRR